MCRADVDWISGAHDSAKYQRKLVEISTAVFTFDLGIGSVPAPRRAAPSHRTALRLWEWEFDGVSLSAALPEAISLEVIFRTLVPTRSVQLFEASKIRAKNFRGTGVVAASPLCGGIPFHRKCGWCSNMLE